MTRTLIADDNPQNLCLPESILKGRRSDMVPVKNGAEAPDTALNTLPDLIITAILMPVMDGFELCRRRTADERLKQVLFLFSAAASTDPNDERFALIPGADR